MEYYIPVKETENANRITVETFYDIGNDYGTKRGYYIMVFPEKVEGHMRSFIAFTGLRRMLMPVARKSKKAEAEAEAIAESVKDGLVRQVLEKNHLEFV